MLHVHAAAWRRARGNGATRTVSRERRAAGMHLGPLRQCCFRQVASKGSDVPLGHEKIAEVRAVSLAQLVLLEAAEGVHDEGRAEGKLLQQGDQGTERHARARLGHAPHLFQRRMEAIIRGAWRVLAER